MKENKYKTLLTLAVYLLLIAIAVILFLLGIHAFKDSNSTQTLFLNLSTEILGVVIITLIVKKLFLLSKESEINEKLESIKKGIEFKFNPIFWSKAYDDKFDIILNDLNNIESVYVLGLNFGGLLKKYRAKFSDAIRQGTKIKILLTDIDSPAGNLVRTVSTSKKEGWIDNSRKDVILAIDDIKKSLQGKKAAKGSLEFRVFPWLFSCSMIIINSLKKESTAKITINPLSINLPDGDIQDHISFVINQKEHPREFKYFKDNFELLWEDPSIKEPKKDESVL